MELNLKQLGKRISKRRKNLKIKQNALAETINTSNNHMSGIENGKEGISLELFVKICNSLNVTPDFLLLGNMHSNNVSTDVSELLRMCSDEDIELIREIAQRFVNLQSTDNRDKL